MQARYRRMMEQAVLSENARSVFLNQLEQKMPRRKNRLLQGAVIAACVCLVLAGTAFAVEALTGFGLIEFVQMGRHNGFLVEYSGVKNYPITAFSEDVRGMNGYAGYSSWEDAEEHLGIDLMDHPALTDPTIRPVYRLIGEGLGLSPRVHCYTGYESMDGQLYRATVNAYYAANRRWEGESRGPTDIDLYLTATVTAEHPGISPDFPGHSSGRFYADRDVAGMSEEQYTAPSGLSATIVTVEGEGRSDIYEASFVLNGISYRITLKGSSYEGAVIPKELLYEFLDGIQF